MAFYLLVLFLCTAPEFPGVFCKSQGVIAAEAFYRLLSCGLGYRLQRTGLSERVLMELRKHDAGSLMMSPANQRHT